VCLATRSQCFISMSWATKSLCLLSENIEEDIEAVGSATSDIEALVSAPSLVCMCVILKLLSQHSQIILQSKVMKSEVITYQTLADSIKPIGGKKGWLGEGHF
jgi:hypothetical protein